jgi:hypothetical protein
MWVAIVSGHCPGVEDRSAMKKSKALKRLAKIEALISDVTERYSASASHIQKALQNARAAVIRAKDAVSLHVSAVANAAAAAGKAARAANKAPSIRKKAGAKKSTAKAKKVTRKTAARKTAATPASGIS